MNRTPTTKVKSLRAALDVFLSAPSADEGLTNEGHINRVLGHLSVRDPASFEAVAEKYEKPVSTFAEAFNAAWHGKRDWRDFDLAVLQETFPALRLPAKVEAAILAEDEAEWKQREYEASLKTEEDSYDEPAFDEEEPRPLALLRRPGPQSRRRKSAEKVRVVTRTVRVKAKCPPQKRCAPGKGGVKSGSVITKGGRKYRVTCFNVPMGK